MRGWIRISRMVMDLSRWSMTRKRFLSGCITLLTAGTCYVMMLTTTIDYVLRNTEPKYLTEIHRSRNISSGVTDEPSSGTVTLTGPTSLDLVRQLVSDRNVRAEDRLKSLSSSREFRYIVAVQVHDRVSYVRALLGSLSAARNITDALVILSHDVVDEDIGHAVHESQLNFEVVQIYFPYSTQLHPYEFPGNSTMDCPERMNKANATKINCTNSDHPDSYGHYRNSRLTQIKHHWWWKLHFVFNRISIAQSNIPVIFLEEDHYVFPDALAVLDQFLELRNTTCTPKCPMLSIGHHRPKFADRQNAYQKFFVQKWAGDNMGIVFDYDHYRRISGCSSAFCTIDDYNWDFTLSFLARDCLKKEYEMLVPLASRVLHIGDCGGVHHTKSCDFDKSVGKAKTQVEREKDKLFPKLLEKINAPYQIGKNRKVNGGWGDPRDHALCRNITRSFARKPGS